MADTTPSDSPLASDRSEPKFDPYSGGEHHSWTEGLPHDFKGWGPQTPDPAEEVHLADDGLTWSGEEDHEHIVWRFDRGHRHH
ncbi:MAG: hypothetical protein IPO30_06875 [Hyphomonadaceae bacterium]|nr:hypothetical protein [Hyphomonadaceae bacterium]